MSMLSGHGDQNQRKKKKANLQISERMNEISIYVETYSEIMRQQLTLYSTSSLPFFKDYMETRINECEEDKYFTADQVSSNFLKKYNNPLTSGR